MQITPIVILQSACGVALERKTPADVCNLNMAAVGRRRCRGWKSTTPVLKLFPKWQLPGISCAEDRIYHSHRTRSPIRPESIASRHTVRRSNSVRAARYALAKRSISLSCCARTLTLVPQTYCHRIHSAAVLKRKLPGDYCIKLLKIDHIASRHLHRL